MHLVSVCLKSMKSSRNHRYTESLSDSAYFLCRWSISPYVVTLIGQLRVYQKVKTFTSTFENLCPTSQSVGELGEAKKLLLFQYCRSMEHSSILSKLQ